MIGSSKYIALNTTILAKKNIRAVNAISLVDMERGIDREYFSDLPHLLISYSDREELICIRFNDDILLDKAYAKIYEELM